MKRNKQKGKKFKKISNPNEEPKYSIDEIVHDDALIKKILIQSGVERGDVYELADKKDELENFTRENLLGQDRSVSLPAKKNPLNKKEKHDREVRSLLLMDSVLDQIMPFTAKEKIGDFAKVIFKLSIGC